VLEVDTTWSRAELRLPGRLLRPVLNRLTLEWPALPAVGDEAFSEAVRQLEVGREGELFPIFGEVAALGVRAGTGGAINSSNRSPANAQT
jgi:hypothetical protein